MVPLSQAVSEASLRMGKTSPGNQPSDMEIISAPSETAQSIPRAIQDGSAPPSNREPCHS